MQSFNKICSFAFVVLFILWPQYCFFVLGFYFYRSGIFIVPMGYVSDIEEAKFSAVLY